MLQIDGTKLAIGVANPFIRPRPALLEVQRTGGWQVATQERLEDYYGRLVYLPDVSRLLPGDIMLTTDVEGGEFKGRKQSSAIRAATRGRFSHALICSTPPTFVEAIGPGVSTLSLARCFTHDIANVRLLRYPDAAVANSAAALVQLEIGRSYSFKRAVRSIFPPDVLAEIDDPGVFCSALVAQAFANAGAPPFTRWPANHTTPATLDNMPGLIDITARMFRQTLAPSNINILSALDGERIETPSVEQTALSKRCAEFVHPIAAALAEAYPETRLDMVPTLFGLVEFVVRAYEATGVVASDKQAAYRARVAEVDRQLERFVSNGEYQAMLAKGLATDQPLISAALHASFMAPETIDKLAMRSLLTTSANEIAVRRDALTHWRTRGAMSQAAMAYLEVDAWVADQLTMRSKALEEILARIDG